MPVHLHAAFGLTIRSQLALPELPTVSIGSSSEVTVMLGEVAPTLEGAEVIGAGVSARPGELLIDYETAAFLVRDGKEITVQPKPGAADGDVRAYLLGSAIGAILHQRGLLPLHANAVEIDGRAVAFAGPSGSGKSTLAAWFRARGHRLLSDDVCAISFSPSGEAMAWPGIPRIKLFSDTLAAFGFDPRTLDRVVNWEDKFSLPLAPGATPESLLLERIYVLKAASTGPQIRELTGSAAFEAVASNIYRAEFAAPLGQAAARFANTVQVLKCARVFEAERALGFDVFETEAARLEAHVVHDLSGEPVGQPAHRTGRQG